MITDWTRAACRDAEPDLFDADPARGENPTTRDRRLRIVAATYCHPCPIRGECLAAYIASRDHGVMRAGHYRAEPRLAVHQVRPERPARRNRRDVTNTIRELAAQGVSDVQIGRELSLSPSAVCSNRKRHRIASGAAVRRGAA